MPHYNRADNYLRDVSTRTAAALALALLGLSACASTTGPSPTSSAAPPASATPERPLTIAFAGDVHFSGRTESHLNDASALTSALQPLADADLAIVNLETAITERGTAEPKSFHFRAPASALEVLDEAGVDAVSLANNHAVDYGPVGLQDTLAAIEASPIAVVGLGANADQAYQPAILTARGHTIALIGATDVPDRTLAAHSADDDSAGVASAARVDDLAAAVKQARTQAETVVVYLHWGTDYTGCPNQSQIALRSRLAAAGADIIVGTHAHELQGAGWAPDGTYVDYGLGNFVWWRSNTQRSITTGVLTLTVEGRRTTHAEWTPMTIDASGLPRQDADPTANLATVEKVRSCAGLAAEPPATAHD